MGKYKARAWLMQRRQKNPAKASSFLQEQQPPQDYPASTQFPQIPTTKSDPRLWQEAQPSSAGEVAQLQALGLGWEPLGMRGSHGHPRGWFPGPSLTPFILGSLGPSEPADLAPPCVHRSPGFALAWPC